MSVGVLRVNNSSILYSWAWVTLKSISEHRIP